MKRCGRLFVAAFLTDASLYLAFAALPFRAIDLGAGPARLGILPTLYAGAYIGSASLGGRLSDRVSRLTLARAGCAVFSLGCLALAFAPGTGLLFLSLPLLGLGLGFFWSPVQAAVADRAAPGHLGRAVGIFNVSWSLGKGTGLVAGGILTEILQPGTALLLAGFPALLNLLLLPRSVPPVSPPQPRPSRENPPGERGIDPERFLRLAWVTNALAFGAASTMNMHAPKFLLARGAGPSTFGILLGSVFVVQTATFALLVRHRPRRASLLVAQAAGIAGLLAFATAPGPGLRILATLPLGLAFGLAYQASIHASLDRARGRGRAAGLHEAVLGGGSSALPLLGGAMAVATGSLSAPFFLGSGLLLGGILLTARSPAGARARAGTS